MTFQKLGLIDPLLRALDALGYREPTPVQRQAIPAVLAGRDVLAAAQTGTGKTAAFALPLLQQLTMAGAAAPQSVRCLVLVPTRELAEQVYDSFRTYSGNLPLRSHVAYGGVPLEPQIAKLRKGLDVLVATPGRLLDLRHQGALHFDGLQTLVLDEADRMLDLGFARELNAVFEALPEKRQVLLFSATFSDDIRKMAACLQQDPVSIQASPRNSATRTVKQWLVTTDKKRKPELFLHLLRQRRWGQALVFVKTRKGADQLVKALQEQGVSADSIHGDKTQPARLRALERFKKAQVQLLVATDVAARGLDIEALPQVINFDLPTVAEDYIHRIGRTGRAGAEGEAISLVCADEVDQLREIETLMRQTIPREEEPGFEADHRVPETGAAGQAAAAAKAAAAGKKKRPFTGPPGGKAAAALPRSALPAGKATSTGRAAAVASKGTAPRPAGSASGHASKPGILGSSGKPGRSAAAPSAPRGAVVVAGGRGAKSTARATARATASKPRTGKR
jgi:superfamily II DNA/RNA helicase